MSMDKLKKLLMIISAAVFMIILSSCGSELVDMKSCTVDTGISEVRGIVWEGRTYAPFCVVEKSDKGRQIGYVDGDKDDKISEYKGYPAEEWLVGWMKWDGGAMLLKEENVTEIPEGLTAEYQ